jgi:hypothetical protein
VIFSSALRQRKVLLPCRWPWWGQPCGSLLNGALGITSSQARRESARSFLVGRRHSPWKYSVKSVRLRCPPRTTCLNHSILDASLLFGVLYPYLEVCVLSHVTFLSPRCGRLIPTIYPREGEGGLTCRAPTI